MKTIASAVVALFLTASASAPLFSAEDGKHPFRIDDRVYFYVGEVFYGVNCTEKKVKSAEFKRIIGSDDEKTQQFRNQRFLKPTIDEKSLLIACEIF